MLKLLHKCIHLTFSKPGLNSMWTVNFQMFKLDLEKAEEPENKLPTSIGSLKKQDSSRNDYAKALVKEESEKVDLKLNIQKTKIMACDPITSWQLDGETMETVRDFILGGSKITADGDCSHEIKSRLLFGRKAMTNIDSIKKA